MMSSTLNSHNASRLNSLKAKTHKNLNNLIHNEQNNNDRLFGQNLAPTSSNKISEQEKI